MFRGVISSPCVLEPANGGEGVKNTQMLSISDMNYYALYWDRVLIPSNKLIYFPVPLEDEYIGEGVLERPVFTIHSSAELIRKTTETQLGLLDSLQKTNPSQDWHLHNIGSLPGIKQELNRKKKSIRFEIFNALPVPPNDVPLVDVLEFKKRNSSTLEDLHSYLGEVYLQIMHSPEDDLSKAKAYAHLEKVLLSLNQVTANTWGNRLFRYNLKLRFPCRKDFVNAFLGTLAACLGSDSKLIMSLNLAQIATGFIEITDDRYTATGLGKDGKNLLYLANAFDEKIL